ncbi:hypothetical protein DPMN_028582 [Dreissena polymorpha]|uniref:Uncharacterized protein n=1 Tax=Dreissena polymorpha TaxID=45954 RepID=A0A9D4LXK0_DREPO|nr:hypothetical protein DPMN_028582 [Dreissena polymorpha]
MLQDLERIIEKISAKKKRKSFKSVILNLEHSIQCYEVVTGLKRCIFQVTISALEKADQFTNRNIDGT